MRFSSDALAGVLAEGSFSYYVTVDVLHGTDRVAQDEIPESWSLTFDLGANLNASGRFRFVHESEKGESWVPVGTRGVLSPYRATLLVTVVVQAGTLEERIQLGLFDVKSVPFAEDAFIERNGVRLVTSTTVEVEVESLDARVLDASLRSPETVAGDALGIWRKFGLLPVNSTGFGSVPTTTYPAERGSRLDLVQQVARIMGGVPVVNYRGEWALVDGSAPTLTLQAWGDQSTVVDLSAELTTDGFYNVVVGNYETEDGAPLRAVWTAPGDLSPEALGREWVRYHASDKVRSGDSAIQAVAAVGALSIQQEVDIPVTCTFNPLLEIGDNVQVEGLDAPIDGVAQRIELRGDVMVVTVRIVRAL